MGVFIILGNEINKSVGGVDQRIVVVVGVGVFVISGYISVDYVVSDGGSFVLVVVGGVGDDWDSYFYEVGGDGVGVFVEVVFRQIVSLCLLYRSYSYKIYYLVIVIWVLVEGLEFWLGRVVQLIVEF